MCINNSYIANAEISSNNPFLASAYLVHEKKKMICVFNLLSVHKGQIFYLNKSNFNMQIFEL